MKPYREVRHGDLSYPVHVGSGLLEQVATIVRSVSRASTAVVISSPQVHRVVEPRLSSFEVLFMNDGEQAKTLTTAELLITELIRKGVRRDSVVIAVGGGVVGDTAGFVASIYMRGIDLVHVPTTLLAQVDSSIGGKVAVNHPLGKNLIGSFYPPKAVLCDIDVLSTLPPRELRSGMFEALKTGVIGDPRLFEMVPEGLIEEIVKRSIDVKASVVSADARESGERRLLNYGHTIGHAIEAALDYEGLTHGDAIAWGMLGANAIAHRRGILSAEERTRIDQAVLGLAPEPATQLDSARVLAALERDKKFTSSRRVMVLPRRVGECVIAEDVSEEEIRYGIDTALQGVTSKSRR